MNWIKKGKVLSVALLTVSLGACDLLTVNDPGRYTGPDLDGALQAVADGVEGRSQLYVMYFAVYTALMADEYQHTGTWSGFDAMDHGTALKTWYTFFSHYHTHGRVFSEQSWDRFERVLGAAEAASSSQGAQVKLARATYTLLSVWHNCEAVTEPAPSPSLSDIEVRKVAAQQFSDAISVAQASGAPFYLNAARAGKAIALYQSGDYAGAVAEASQVPDGYTYGQIFNQSLRNYIVTITTKGHNEAAGLMSWLWPRIDQTEDSHTYVRDWATNEHDMRMPAWFDGEIATDNITPHYSQYKYQTDMDPIAIYHSDHMKLIEAESMVMNGDYAGATAVLNGLRSAVGLAALDVPDNEEMMMEALLNERFAELFMEGWRWADLHRFGLMRERFDSFNDPERPGADRPTQWAGSTSETRYNDMIEDDDALRCWPRA